VWRAIIRPDHLTWASTLGTRALPLAYLLMIGVFDWLALLARSDISKDVEKARGRGAAPPCCSSETGLG
jgi:hypothetical protein